MEGLEHENCMESATRRIEDQKFAASGEMDRALITMTLSRSVCSEGCISSPTTFVCLT